jgi:hypothetical protein
MKLERGQNKVRTVSERGINDVGTRLKRCWNDIEIIAGTKSGGWNHIGTSLGLEDM